MNQYSFFGILVLRCGKITMGVLFFSGQQSTDQGWTTDVALHLAKQLLDCCHPLPSQPSQYTFCILDLLAE